jgi:hypothetical protein
MLFDNLADPWTHDASGRAAPVMTRTNSSVGAIPCGTMNHSIIVSNRYLTTIAAFIA